ncbi:FAD-dependent oxidoreductase [Heliobacillus mobilis]|uniref:FAD-dependent oxidoreductase n=1 Tax=Heliobacterium mobile TaxID=28064 RepID=A0A6I3SPP6_HELMO|nr:NAD(P)/FAD-dependent oxidoreductase [Heliobacterium mobile]MTV51033.1 FAD-dependent oxidoreductase [Heliobacterium mobile]
MTKQKPRIVILGAGYGGILTTVHLQKLLLSDEAEIILINKHDYHYQTTLLHEVAAGTGDENRICIPIKEVIDTQRIRFIKDTVLGVQKEERQVILSHGGTLTYDYLVVALGFQSATFGIPGIMEHALMIRSMNSARKIRNKIESLFADFARVKDLKQTLTLIVGGAGFTGIEFVGELADKVSELCKKHGVDRQRVRLLNVEGGPGILGAFDPSLAAYAKESLERMGVEFRLSTRIKSVDAQGAILASDQGEETISPATVIWTGGVQGNSVVCGTAFDAPRGRIPVEKDLRIKGYENVFVIGDCSAVMDPQTERPFPPTAQLAVMQSATCARNLTSLIRGEQRLEAFHPLMKGSVASLGAHDGAGVILGLKTRGKLAVLAKAIVDNRYLYILGGPKLLFGRGKFTMYCMQTAYTTSSSGK